MLSSSSARRLVAGAVAAKSPFLSSSRNVWRNNGGQIFLARNLTGKLALTNVIQPSRYGELIQKHTRTAEAAASHIPRSEAPKPRSRLGRAFKFTSLALFAFVTGVSIAPIRIASSITADSIPTDAETLHLFQPPDEATQTIENHIKTHPLAQKLRNSPDYNEARPHLKLPEEFRGRNVIGGALLGPNRLAVPPYVFNEKSGKDLVAIAYLGHELCGHPGIVHGGMLATLLDEALARCCFPVLPNGIGVTANLSIDYKKPVIADRYVVVRAETVKHEGRKAWVTGRVETLPEGDEQAVVLVEAKGLFVEPKYASVSRPFSFSFSFFLDILIL